MKKRYEIEHIEDKNKNDQKTINKYVKRESLTGQNYPTIGFFFSVCHGLPFTVRLPLIGQRCVCEYVAFYLLPIEIETFFFFARQGNQTLSIICEQQKTGARSFCTQSHITMDTKVSNEHRKLMVMIFVLNADGVSKISVNCVTQRTLL